MPLCKNCDHNCHHSDIGTNCVCASCDCANCEHAIEEALEKLQDVINPVKTVEFDPDMDLNPTEH